MIANKLDLTDELLLLLLLLFFLFLLFIINIIITIMTMITLLLLKHRSKINNNMQAYSKQNQS